MAPTAVQAQQQAADLIVTNARIYTVDERRPFGDAMAIAGGRVLFVGSQRGALALRGPRTRVVDLDGRTIIPGMVDAHVHLLGLGMALRTVDLTGTRSYDEVIARVAARAREVPAGHLDPRPRLGPERLGRHALPIARGAVARRARPSRVLDAGRRTRGARERARDAAAS